MNELVALSQGRRVSLPFVRDLAASESNALGFLSNEAMEWYQANGMIIAGSVNNDATCFALGKLGTTTYPDAACLYMSCVRMDARRHKHASWLLGHVSRLSRIQNLSRIQLWCRAELAANELWFAAGMIPIAIRAGGKGRDLPQICWTMSLNGEPVLAEMLSTRRRGRAGIPEALHPQVTPLDVIKAVRGDPVSVKKMTIEAAGLFKPKASQFLLFDSTADLSDEKVRQTRQMDAMTR